jgi:hypothetical protein
MRMIAALLILCGSVDAGSVPPAPIVCTTNVPKRICSMFTSFFSLEQAGSNVLKDVQITVADKAAFKRERDRITAIWLNSSHANPEKSETKKPFLLSGNDDTLFERGESKTRTVEKVFISADAFQADDSSPDIDKIAGSTMFVLGYVEGCFYTRMQEVSEEVERVR